jgi:hypothetical protein
LQLFSLSLRQRIFFRVSVEKEIFIYCTASIPILALIHPTIQWVPGDHSMEVKLPIREDDIKNGGAISPFPRMVLN